MRHLKQFQDFVNEGVVKRVAADKERAKSLIKEADRKMKSLNEQLEKIGIKDENANDYVEYCYDIILNLIRAKLLVQGFSATGQGAHEAEISYLRELGFSEKDTMFADQLRYFRNGILYYGTSLDKEYADSVIKFQSRLCRKLKEVFKRDQFMP